MDFELGEELVKLQKELLSENIESDESDKYVFSIFSKLDGKDFVEKVGLHRFLINKVNQLK